MATAKELRAAADEAERTAKFAEAHEAAAKAYRKAKSPANRESYRKASTALAAHRAETRVGAEKAGLRTPVATVGAKGVKS